jgi:hypothetical protein
MEKIYTYTVTATSSATAQKSDYLGKKHVRLDAYSNNAGYVYPAIQYESRGAKPETDFDFLAPSDVKFYSAPKGKKISYVWFYALNANDILRVTATDGAIKDFQTSKFQGKFKRNKTTITLVNNTDLTTDITVPTGKIWKIYGGKAENPDNVARTVNVIAYDKNTIQLGYLESASVGANGYVVFPCAGRDATKDTGVFSAHSYPIIAEAGDFIRFIHVAGGVSAGGVGTIFLYVVEYDVL